MAKQMNLAVSNAPVSNAPGSLGRDQSTASDFNYGDDPDSETARWRRCIFGKFSLKDAKALVDGKADPNCRFKYKLGPKEFQGTPLTLAVKLDKPALVRKLIDFKADPQSEYSMSAGRLRVHWTGPAVCATVAKGNLSMMRLLVECEASLHGSHPQGRVICFDGEPNVTLLYDASYFGHAHLVQYLLHQKGDPDVDVKFQDDLNITKRPLQISCSLGHDEVVRVLLSAKAQISPDTGDGPQELQDAIDGCHVEVVRLLTQAGADLFCGEEGRRGIDYLFNTNNAVLIASAAKGLRGAREDLVELIQLPDFVRFLATPDAEEILSAVFRKCELRYWQGQRRIIWKTAYILHGDMNVAVGPHKEHMEESFQQQMQKQTTHQTDKEKQQVEEQFLSQLLPHRKENLKDASKIPVEIWRGLLPGLHRNPEVLWVLASGLNDRVFDEKGARAIIELAWAEASLGQKITFTLDLLVALLFWALAFLLNDRRLQDEKWHWLRTVALVILMVIWVRNVAIEFLQCVGFHALRKLWQYFRSLENLADFLRIIATGFSQIALVTSWDEFETNQVLRVIFAITGFVRWLRVLNSLKGFESTGKPMLPILQAVPATLPFFIVVLCWFSGFMHMYYSFGLTDWWTSGMIMYRLGFLADFSRNEMVSVEVEDIWAFWVDSVLVFMGLSMSIIMMNILIGVLAESYNRGWEHRERLFLLERSRLVLQHFTTARGWSKICICRRQKVQAEFDAQYVWFAYPKDPASWGEIQADNDADSAMNVHEKVTELRKEIRDMHEDLVRGKQDVTHNQVHSSCSFEDSNVHVGKRLNSLETAVDGLKDKIDQILQILPR